MKEKITLITIVLGLFIAGYVYASTVTTTDGKNFTVTNDAGFSTNMTMDQINRQASSSASMAAEDSIRYLADQEIAYSWGAVLQGANAVINNSSN